MQVIQAAAHDQQTNGKLAPTNIGLLVRLRNAADFAAWQDFIRLYEKLIYRAAIKAGLCEGDAGEVLQQTLISVARRMESFRYEPERCSFKGWLMHVTRGHIKDCQRKRQTQAARFESSEAVTSPLEDIPDTQAEQALETMWTEEWRAGVLSEANSRVKLDVKAKHYEIYELYCLKGLSVQEVSKRLSILPVTVRVVSYRVVRRVRQEVRQIERQPF
jgi:RNA polymerase sigma-70 factor (ECF subfamily)